MKVLLIEDHALFREGVSLILQQLDEAMDIVCGETAQQALDAVAKGIDYDLILLDYHLPDGNGLNCLTGLREQQPMTPIIMLSAEQNSQLIQLALSKGAKGFITKQSSSQVMLSAIQLVLSGGLYVPAEMLNPATSQRSAIPESAMAHTVNLNAGPGGSKTPLAAIKPTKFHLTERQKEVLHQMLNGQSNKEIAKVLNMSPSTVKVHVAAILRELHVKNRTQAVNIAKNAGIFD